MINSSENTNKLDYIDALRGLAILGVLMVHVSLYGNSNLTNIISKFLLEGGRGVQLFFISSAFTLFLSFKYRIRKDIFPARNFFIRRFFRIAPMYFIGILYYLFQEGLGPRYWLGDETHISVANITSNFLFLHGFNPYWISSIVPGGWSIAVEMAFYVILPFLFSKIKNINQALNFFIISLLIRVVLNYFFIKYPLISHERLWGDYLFFYFPNQLPIFSLGIIMFFIIIEKNVNIQLSGRSLLIVSILLLIQLSTNSNLIFPNHIFFGIAFLIFGVALSKYKYKLIVNPVINFIGKISFSMYLVHFAVLYWLTKINCIDFTVHGILNYCLRYCLVSILTILISYFFYKFIELPFQQIGKRLITKLEENYPNREIKK